MQLCGGLSVHAWLLDLTGGYSSDARGGALETPGWWHTVLRTESRQISPELITGQQAKTVSSGRSAGYTGMLPVKTSQ